MSDAPDVYGVPIPWERSLAALGGGGAGATAAPAPPARPAAPGPGPVEEGREATAADALVDRFQARPPRHRLEDVVLSEGLRRQVSALIAKLEHHRKLYEEWGLAQVEPAGRRLAFNLYGPPGTGKTMLAEALAGRLGRSVIEVSYAEIESRYVGDTPKNIVAAFRAAARSGAALFFDEADSILGKRMTAVTQAADHGVNVSRAVMLEQLDGFEGVVMFATNLARNFDPAFVRRILYHVEVGLPDEAGRLALWRRLVPDAMPGKASLDLEDLARRSEGLAGGDIRNAVILGAVEAVQRVDAAQRLEGPDLLRAIEAVRRARRDVGPAAEPPAWREVSEGEASGAGR